MRSILLLSGIKMSVFILEANGVINGTANTSATGLIVPCCFFMAIIPLSLFRRNFETNDFSNFEQRRIGRTLLADDLGHGGPILPTVSLKKCFLWTLL